MKETVRILFVGDIALGGDYFSRFATNPSIWTEPFIEIKPIFRSADLRIGNLESPLSLSSTPQCKRNLLGAPQGAIEALNYLGFTALSLANNHLTDQGTDGLAKTCEILSTNNIAHFGAGKNLAAAIQPAIIRCKGFSFAFLGYAAEAKDVCAQPATAFHEGCTPLSLERIERDIDSLRGMVSFIIVSLHWGYQFDLYPEPQQIEMARKIIDLGALIVHGHHPHVLQGVERYRSGLIMYSLGNFFFPNFKRTDNCWFRFPRESSRTVVVQCDVGIDGLQSITQIPLSIGSNNHLRILSGSSAFRVRIELDRRSAMLNDADYPEQWLAAHKKTMAWRARLELRLRLCGAIKMIWNKVRTRGLLMSLARFRPRDLIEVIRHLRIF